MNTRFSEELCLTNETGRMLYHKYAEHMPIIDYHCHLQPKEIWENRQFEDIGEMWLSGDHYKWRAMRTFGIDEKYITGKETSYHEKYLAFAEILPQLIGNPIYIWCALELKRFFGIDEPLGKDNAEEIYQKTKAMIQEKNITPRWCMEISNVELVSTTEDPVDDLRYHIALKNDPTMKTRVITAFRPDKAMFAAKPGFGAYVDTLAEAAEMEISSFADLLTALEKRLQYFKEITGTTVSDDGIPDFTWVKATPEEIEIIFEKARSGQALTKREDDQYRSAFLFEMGKMYNRNGYVMQLHIGTYLDANTKYVNLVGQSTGFDCADDTTQVQSVGELLNQLTLAEQLPKTILYCLDGTNTENYAILAAGFCEKATRAKVQLGAPWWFHDQIYGIDRQFRAASNLYPISLSVGMLTDSRSFLSYPRHELYRRVLCNFFGELVERGEYFSGEEELAKVIQNICYNNVKEYFGF
jgi:glucuronate isomerase